MSVVGRQCTFAFWCHFSTLNVCFFCTPGRLDLHHKVVFIAIIHMDFKYLMKSTGCARERKRNRPDRVHVNEMENKVLIHHLLYNRYIFQPYFRRHVTCDSCNVRFYFSRYFFSLSFLFPCFTIVPKHLISQCHFFPALHRSRQMEFHRGASFFLVYSIVYAVRFFRSPFLWLLLLFNFQLFAGMLRFHLFAIEIFMLCVLRSICVLLVRSIRFVCSIILLEFFACLQADRTKRDCSRWVR